MLFRFVPLSLSVREKNMQPVRFAVLLLRSLQTKTVTFQALENQQVYI